MLDLLFALAAWQAFAKLRLHTDSTVGYLSVATTELGTKLCRFVRTTCEAYVTHELPREQEGRARRKRAKAARGTPGETAPDPLPPTSAKRKMFNMFTYKLHALGDYLMAILQYGTSDSYSTQVVGP